MKVYVILISVIAALGGLLFGFDTAVISGTINFLQPYFGLTEARLGWTVSSLLFGCIAGVIIAGKAVDQYVSKKILMLAALLFFISAVGSATAHALVFFLAARVLGGLAVGVASILSPMYIAEVAPAKYHRTLISMNQLAIVSLWIACTVVTIVFPIMLEKLSGGITFLVFSLICLVNLLYVWRNVPETKGKTLEELEKKFAQK